MLRAVQIDRLDRFGREKTVERLLGLGRPVLPQRAAQPIPCGGEAYLVRIGVLDDEPLQRVRIAGRRSGTRLARRSPARRVRNA